MTSDELRHCLDTGCVKCEHCEVGPTSSKFLSGCYFYDSMQKSNDKNDCVEAAKHKYIIIKLPVEMSISEQFEFGDILEENDFNWKWYNQGFATDKELFV